MCEVAWKFLKFLLVNYTVFSPDQESPRCFTKKIWIKGEILPAKYRIEVISPKFEFMKSKCADSSFVREFKVVNTGSHPCKITDIFCSNYLKNYEVLRDYSNHIAPLDTMILPIKVTCKKELWCFDMQLVLKVDSAVENGHIYIEANYPHENYIKVLDNEFEFRKSLKCDSSFVKEFLLVNAGGKACSISEIEQRDGLNFVSKYEILGNYTKKLQPGDTLKIKIKVICQADHPIYCNYLYVDVEDAFDHDEIFIRGRSD
jgi:hypothetical protein